MIRRNYVLLPMVQMLIPYVIGVVSGLSYAVPKAATLTFFIFLMALLLLCHFMHRYASRWLFGLVLNLLVLIFGYENARLRLEEEPADNLPGNEAAIFARVAGVDTSHAKYLKVQLHLLKIDSVNVKPKVRYALMSIKKNSIQNCIQLGDALQFRSNLVVPDHSKNPYSFNYKRYLSDKRIYYLAYPVSDVWRIGRLKGGIKYWALQQRKRIQTSFASLKLEKDSFAVFSALVLGDKSLLSQNTKLDFSASGLSHVLAISGMHVGIIFLLAMWLFGRFKRVLPMWSQYFITIAALWLYALITGLSPSVQRAALMFTLFVVVKWLDRPRLAYNTVAISALVLLIINPLFVRSVGFQMSYTAVLGIVAFYKPIENLWSPRYWLIKQYWSLSTISIAAQLGVAPLLIYYFHNISMVFIFSNLLAIPLLLIIFNMGLLIMLCSIMHVPILWTEPLLSVLLNMFRGNAHFFGTMPFANIESLSCSPLTILSYYIMVASLALLIKGNWERHMKWFYISSTFFVLSLLFPKVLSLKKNRLITLGNKSAITILQHGDEACVVAPNVPGDWMQQELDVVKNRGNFREWEIVYSDSLTRKAQFDKYCFMRCGQGYIIQTDKFTWIVNQKRYNNTFYKQGVAREVINVKAIDTCTVFSEGKLVSHPFRFEKIWH